MPATFVVAYGKCWPNAGRGVVPVRRPSRPRVEASILARWGMAYCPKTRLQRERGRHVSETENEFDLCEASDEPCALDSHRDGRSASVRRSLRCLTMVVAEQPTEKFPALDRPIRSAYLFSRVDQSIAKPLMVPFVVVVSHELVDRSA